MRILGCGMVMMGVLFVTLSASAEKKGDLSGIRSAEPILGMLVVMRDGKIYTDDDKTRLLVYFGNLSAEVDGRRKIVVSEKNMAGDIRRIDFLTPNAGYSEGSPGKAIVTTQDGEQCFLEGVVAGFRIGVLNRDKVREKEKELHRLWETNMKTIVFTRTLPRECTRCGSLFPPDYLVCPYSGVKMRLLIRRPTKPGAPTIIIASTEGNVSIPDREEKVGLNIYRKKP